MTRAISAAVARRFLVLHHLLAPPRALPPGTDSVLAVVDRLGSLQFDPLEVAGRNHDLVLQARISGYRRAFTDELLYERRLLFEAINKGLSLLPTRELPWYRVTWDWADARHADGVFREHKEAVDEILERIRHAGPITSLDLERGAVIDWYWAPTSRGRALLEALSEAGILGLARREGNRRFYDLIERLYPADLLAERIPEREQLRHKLLSRYRAHGLLGATGQAEIFLGLGRARSESTRPDRRTMLAELIDRGELLPVQVEGMRGLRHIVADELPILAAAEREVAQETLAARGPVGAGASRGPGGAPTGVSFIAPLDPLAWDRDYLRTLFGFEYIWEVYVPAAKRRWGYYVLPLLYGDRFVGRIEPRIERQTKLVRILGLWWEPGFDPLAEEGFVGAFADALLAYVEFAGARGVRLGRTGGPGFGPAVRDAMEARTIRRVDERAEPARV